MSYRAVAVVALVLAGCATPMRVESNPPGATVRYQGRTVGVTPATVEIDAGEVGSSIELTLEHGGVVKNVSVPRSEVHWGSAAFAAAADGTACATITGVGLVAGLVFPPCFLVVCAAPATYVALPLQLYLAGAAVPERVSVTMRDPPPSDDAVALAY